MRPLLMVHGIAGSPREAYGVPGKIFKNPRPKSMYLCLTSLGYQPGRDLFWYTYPTFQPISSSAQRLHTEISRVREASGSSEVDLLTFSLGGIIAKYHTIAPQFQHEIRRLIMIAPPFHGSHWADWCRAGLRRNRRDILFSGDGHVLSPQILSFRNPFLQELAAQAFPSEIETTIIAANCKPTERGPVASYVRWLTGWVGAGDLIVPLESTRVPVHHFFEVTEEFSLGIVHRYLPYHPRVQRLVTGQLRPSALSEESDITRNHSAFGTYDIEP